ncbi:histidine kinase dimerization/phospho-acceptor domain-containing protein [Sediminibacterium sp.]|uniref:histidine kinase dimerization/phospho-acceptor domain-containing protein n=1 Tax=Sediminibacterium sp. TaxID=1917865 RepID=UPI0025E686BF|nr:histidine kinase dimerization/phospho-acceptor domain-containing protein [Sediminibacterium sp.]MBT9485156.1 hypothetical protein [Sediminibacterium sp.]
MFLFVRTLLYRESHFRKNDWLHTIPFIISVIELIPFYLSGAEHKLGILQNENLDFATHITNFNEGFIGKDLHYFFKAGSWAIYFYYSLKVYFTFRKKIKTAIISDYNRKFAFLRFFLLTKVIGFFPLNITTLFAHSNQLYTNILIASNFISLINIFLLAFEYPEMIYGKDFYSVTENNRENLMKIVMSQTENLKFLENSRHEANILLDVNYKVIYFNKLAEIKFCELYSHTLQLNEDFTDYLDPVSKDNFFTYFQQSLQGKTIQAEEKFMLHNESNFTWLQISFIAHYAENGKLIGVSIGATAIDAKRKMEQLQAKYLQSLDELAWNSSHILRAPVANMMGILQLLQETNIALDDTERAQFLKHLSSEVKRVDTVIKDMVAKARKGLEN